MNDGSVFAWGCSESRGDTSEVNHLLVNMRDIASTQYVFAALLADKIVITWGKSANAALLPKTLGNVEQITGSANAFVAVLSDGHVVAWGHEEMGAHYLHVYYINCMMWNAFLQLTISDNAFAALRKDDFVVTWGDSLGGGI